MNPFADRVEESVTGTGTGVLTLAGAASGKRAVSAEYANTERFYYCIEEGTGGATAWEVGFGYRNNTDLVRERVDYSSNSNNAVDFGGGTKRVFVTLSAKSYFEQWSARFASWRVPISW